MLCSVLCVFKWGYAYDVRVSMLVYPNNLNYLHNNRAYFRIILGKNGITSMALCGYPLTSAPILSYSRKIGDEKIVEENS